MMPMATTQNRPHSAKFADSRAKKAVSRLNREIERRITIRNMLALTVITLALIYVGCRLIWGW